MPPDVDLKRRMCAFPSCTSFISDEEAPTSRYCLEHRSREDAAAEAPPAPPRSREGGSHRATSVFAVGGLALAAIIGIAIAIGRIASRPGAASAPGAGPERPAQGPPVQLVPGDWRPGIVCRALDRRALVSQRRWSSFGSMGFGCGGEFEVGPPNTLGLSSKVQFEASSPRSDLVEVIKLSAVVNNRATRALALAELRASAASVFEVLDVGAPARAIEGIERGTDGEDVMPYGTVSLRRAPAKIEIWDLRIERRSGPGFKTPAEPEPTVPSAALPSDPAATRTDELRDEDPRARLACARGWEAMARNGAAEHFDAGRFHSICIRRMADAVKECSRPARSRSEVSACIDAIAPSLAMSILAESL